MAPAKGAAKAPVRKPVPQSRPRPVKAKVKAGPVPKPPPALYMPPPGDALPWKVLAVVALANVTNTASYVMTFPFVPFMLSSFMRDVPDTELGYYSGLLEGLYHVGAFFGALFWGQFSDSRGRRPALLLGLLGTVVSCVWFGLSGSYATALLSRFLWGSLNGNVGVAKTILSEVCNDNNSARAFSIIGVMTGLGRLLGPAVGGLLSEPARKYPQWFGPGAVAGGGLIGMDGIFVTYPYLLPCVVMAVLATVNTLMTFIWLPETLHLSRLDASATGQPEGTTAATTATSNKKEDSGNGAVAGPTTVAVAAKDVERKGLLSAGDDDDGLDLEAAVQMAIADGDEKGEEKVKAKDGKEYSNTEMQGSGVDMTEEWTPEWDQEAGEGTMPSPERLSITRPAASSAQAEQSRRQQSSPPGTSSKSKGNKAQRLQPLEVEGPVVSASRGKGEGTGTKGAGVGLQQQTAAKAKASEGKEDDDAAFASFYRDCDLDDLDERLRINRQWRAVTPKWVQKLYACMCRSRRRNASTASFDTPAAAASAPAGPEKSVQAWMRLMRDRPVAHAVAVYGALGVVALVSNELLPLFLLNSKEYGGFSWTSSEIGLIAMAAGPPVMLFQGLIYDKIAKALGMKRLSNWSLVAFAVFLASTPLCSLALRGPSWMPWALMSVHYSLSSIVRITSFTCTFVFVANSALPADRGKVNGLGQAFVSIFRAIGPPIGTAAFAWSVSDANTAAGWPFNFHFVWSVLACAALGTMALSNALPDWIEKKRLPGMR